MTIICAECGIKHHTNNRSEYENRYCSNKCQGDARHRVAYEKAITEWESGEWNGMTGYQTSKHIRKYIFDKNDNKCSRCGWAERNPFTGKIPLDLEHIDGDPYNNAEENLTCLCPNCHSLTKSYKGANRGNGRLARKKNSIHSILGSNT